ncbi:MAG TPA: acyltransferase family protein [Acidimicrobiia bacterium]|nr:acyltransferase family protein [Acidimicrobiia bacterium]
MGERQESFAYRPALDGLRALAVGAVIAYHLGYGWARGGFLGVDAFFVLSGYLITSLLLIEYGGRGRIRLRAFWARRARRLLPALFLVLTVVSVWAAWAWPGDQLGVVRGDGLATLFYGANWRFVATGQSYFALVALPSPFRHAWSLAIEEQFYLVWPLVVFACLAIGRGRARVLGWTCVLGSIASIVAMAALYDPADPSRAYYGTDARAHALLIGALLAIVLRRWATLRPGEGRARSARTAGRAGNLLAAVGVLAAGACLAAFGLVSERSSWMYGGGFALFAVTIALVITAAVAPGPSPVRRVLSWAPLVWIGRISYGLYLWHWPVQLALTSERVGLDGVELDLVRIGATLAIATLSFYAVEMPIRRGVFGRRVRRVLTPVAAGGVAAVLLATTAGATAPPAYLQGGGRQGIEQALARVSKAARKSPPPSTTTAPPTTAPAAPGPPAPATPPATVMTAPPHRILAVGDSLLASLLPGLMPAARSRGLDLQSIAIPGCGVVTGEPLAPDDSHLSWAAGCGKDMARLQLTAVQKLRPDVVLWMSSWETADRIVDGTQYDMDSIDGIRMTLQLVDEAVHRLTSTGARVAFLTIAPTLPTLEYGAPTAEATRRVLLLDRLLTQYAADHPATSFAVPLADQYCPGLKDCPQQIGGIDVRNADGRHFSPAGAAWISPWVLDQLTAPRPVPVTP